MWWQERHLLAHRRGTPGYMGSCMRSYGCGDTMTRTCLPGMKIFPTRGEIFFLIFDDPLRIRSSFSKCNKKILPCGGGGLLTPLCMLGGAGDSSPPIYAWWGGGGILHPHYVCLVGGGTSPSPAVILWPETSPHFTLIENLIYHSRFQNCWVNFRLLFTFYI